MAGELQTSNVSGLTLYALVFNPAKTTIWQTTTSTFVTFVLGNIANYRIALTDLTGLGDYKANMPAAAAGKYPYVIRDAANTLYASGEINWNGTGEVYQLGDAYTVATEIASDVDTMTTTLSTIISSYLTPIASYCARLYGALVISYGTPVANPSSTTVTLSAGSSSVDNYYRGCTWSWGAETRIITGYVGATKVATLSRPLNDAVSAGTYFISSTQQVGITASGIFTPACINSASFSVTADAGIASGILEKLSMLYRRFYGKVVKTDNTSIVVKADDGTTTLTTQTCTTNEAGDDQTINAAT